MTRDGGSETELPPRGITPVLIRYPRFRDAHRDHHLLFGCGVSGERPKVGAAEVLPVSVEKTDAGVDRPLHVPVSTDLADRYSLPLTHQLLKGEVEVTGDDSESFHRFELQVLTVRDEGRDHAKVALMYTPRGVVMGRGVSRLSGRRGPEQGHR